MTTAPSTCMSSMALKAPTVPAALATPSISSSTHLALVEATTASTACACEATTRSGTSGLMAAAARGASTTRFPWCCTAVGRSWTGLACADRASYSFQVMAMACHARALWTTAPQPERNRDYSACCGARTSAHSCAALGFASNPAILTFCFGAPGAPRSAIAAADAPQCASACRHMPDSAFTLAVSIISLPS